MTLAIEADWEQGDDASPEERSTFAALGIRYSDIWLTQAEDAFVKRLRDKVPLSAYRLAAWLAWNWWRLRWEPQRRSTDWALAHRMTTIGGGYVWPNITIVSDGHRMVLLTKPTESSAAEPLRYVQNVAAVVRATEFESAVDLFVEQVRGKLQSDGIRDTGLDKCWKELTRERSDAQLAKRRRFEATLGHDPDEGDASLIDRLIDDSADLGEDAVVEIAADRRLGVGLSAEHIRDVAARNGSAANPQSAVVLAPGTQLPPFGAVPAWRRGMEAAASVRTQQRLGDAPLTNTQLSDFAGVAPAILSTRETHSELSFVLVDSDVSSKIVLRPKWETGRRFDLARSIGDRLAGGAASPTRFFPSTQSSTYRQQVQRAFAAHLLCPFQPLEQMLAGDYSQEAIEDAARHYIVSPLVVRTLLVNHGRLEREDLEGDSEIDAAA
ncbi:MAG: hypothetical protein ABL996_16545 [Micropepsaceae bacterium]